MRDWILPLPIIGFAAALVLSGCAGGAQSPFPRLGLSGTTLETHVQGRSPIYCYRTLADPDCYAYPRPELAHRLISGYPPAAD